MTLRPIIVFAVTILIHLGCSGIIKGQVRIEFKNGATVTGHIARATETAIILRIYQEKAAQFVEVPYEKSKISRVWDLVREVELTPELLHASTTEEMTPIGSTATPQESKSTPDREDADVSFITSSPESSFSIAIGTGYSSVNQQDWNQRWIAERFYDLLPYADNQIKEEMTGGLYLFGGFRYLFGKSLELELDGMYLQPESKLQADGELYDDVLQINHRFFVDDALTATHVELRLGCKLIHNFLNNHLAIFLRAGGGVAYMRYDRSAKVLITDRPDLSKYINEEGYYYGLSTNVGTGFRAYFDPVAIACGLNYRYVPKESLQSFTTEKLQATDGYSDPLPQSHVLTIPLEWDMTGFEYYVQVAYHF